MPNYNERYIEKWIRYLNDTDRDMSRRAAEKLGETMDTSVVPELVRALKGRPDDVRLAAVRSLGLIADTQAVKPLIELLGDYNPLIASTAAEALGDIRDKSAIPALSKILRDYKQENSRHNQIHGSERGLYMAAVDALKRFNSIEAKSALKKYYRP